ncbi:MAG: hypothetical protein F4X62_12425 [Caldilineaceae bacterium SB0662_bin_25]|nr:hypothetical protein [Caldilineaceae bacterium SB0662_bin_25]
MDFTTHLVRRFSDTPFHCNISMFMQTLVYEIPRYRVSDDQFPPCVVKETSDFKAAIVTNPVDYILSDTFSDQHIVDPNFEKNLRSSCGENTDNVGTKTFIVFQCREDLGSFPANGGQCITVHDEGQEKRFIYDCQDAPAPKAKDNTDIINMVLAAAKAELELTGADKQIFGNSCYKTIDEQCVYMGVPPSGSVRVSLVGPPITHDAFLEKVTPVKTLVAKLENGVEQDTMESLKDGVTDFGTRLRELIEALQLDPSLDDAYLRLWYLQLWDRVDKFRRLFARRRSPQNLRDDRLQHEKNHRDRIAHRGVDKVDGRAIGSLQGKVLSYFKHQL